MVRFLLRMLGYLSVAAGFVVLVLDGARSIANSAVLFTPFGQTLALLLRERYASLQPMVERNIHPLLWDPVLLGLMRAPAALVACLLGFLLLWAGTPPRPEVGVLTRR